MNRCPVNLVDAAAEDRLPPQEHDSLRSHLSSCESCRARLDNATASRRWWDDASRLLDITSLDDPSADVDDSSTPEARMFESGDPVGELRDAGVLEAAPHPEVLGRLGRYIIEREIGTGGMGVVLKGFDSELNRTVAIKVLAPHLARSGAARQRFVREGRAAAAVVHENVVSIHEVNTAGRLPSLVMRYVDGISLQRHVDNIGPLPVCDALRIAAQTAAGLDAAHRQGIVHRDVKPANILVSPAGQRVWITDFGLARAVDDASLTRTGFIAGTPHYMSPEQARGGTVGPASDLFSLGGVIYFMLAARPPWRAERSLAVLHRIVQEPHRPLWQLNPDVPREISDLVDELLSKSDTDRIDSASSVQQKLEAFLSKLQNPPQPHPLGADQESNGQSLGWLQHPLLVIPLTAFITALFFLTPNLIQRFQSNQGNVKVPDAASVGIPDQSEYAVDHATEDDASNQLPSLTRRTTESNEKDLSSGVTHVDDGGSTKLMEFAGEAFKEEASSRATNGFVFPHDKVETNRSANPIAADHVAPSLPLPGPPHEENGRGPAAPQDSGDNWIKQSSPPTNPQARENSTIRTEVWEEILLLDRMLDEAEAFSRPQDVAPLITPKTFVR